MLKYSSVVRGPVVGIPGDVRHVGLEVAGAALAVEDGQGVARLERVDAREPASRAGCPRARPLSDSPKGTSQVAAATSRCGWEKRASPRPSCRFQSQDWVGSSMAPSRRPRSVIVFEYV